MKFSLVVLTLNEIEAARVIMPRVDRSLFDQIIFLDGRSTDGTAEWAREQGFEVYVQRERGLRAAYREALPLLRGDVMITFSPDGNSVPEVLPDLVAKMREGWDMVIVSRYLPPAKSEDDDVITRFGNWMFTTILNVLYRAHYTDAMVMYRAYKVALIKQLRLDTDDGFTIPERLFRTRVSIEPMLSLRAAKYGLKIAEIPGDEPARLGGQRKLQIVRWGLTFLWQFIVERFKV